MMDLRITALRPARRAGVLLITMLLAGLLAGCSTGWVPPERESRPPGSVFDERVRAPEPSSNEELQVFTVRNPAVVTLGRQAAEAEQAGDRARAQSLLERALRIDGRDPEILQHLAEIHFEQGRLDQAGSFAARAWEFGPQVGEICQRSLRTLMQVREREGEYDGAWQAYAKLPECRVAPPERF
ncbi:MAG: tetratricopeptide repeat protein [Wenzhouxiangellaceae bacterium]|nr:tetratricopeptide repeat protein [Wenzhouxiangellaceae bacterium]